MGDELSGLKEENKGLQKQPRELAAQTPSPVPPAIQLYVRQEVDKAKRAAATWVTLAMAVIGALTAIGLWQGLTRYVDEKAKRAVDSAMQESAIRAVRSEIKKLETDAQRVHKIFEELRGLVIVKYPVPVPPPEPPVLKRPKAFEIRPGATTQETLQAFERYVKDLQLYSRELELILDAYRRPKESEPAGPSPTPRPDHS